MVPRIKMKRVSPGYYEATCGRVWVVARMKRHRDYGGGIGWVAYVKDDPNTVIDPLETLRDTKKAIQASDEDIEPRKEQSVRRWITVKGKRIPLK